jgi:hypothetical protein
MKLLGLREAQVGTPTPAAPGEPIGPTLTVSPATSPMPAVKADTVEPADATM